MTHFAYQLDPNTLIQRWGIWGLILFASGIVIWWWVLPRIDEYLKAKRAERAAEREEMRAQNKRFVDMISGNLEAAQKARELERDKFLEVVDGSLRKQTEVLETLADRIEDHR